MQYKNVKYVFCFIKSSFDFLCFHLRGKYALIERKSQLSFRKVNNRDILRQKLFGFFVILYVEL